MDQRKLIVGKLREVSKDLPWDAEVYTRPEADGSCVLVYKVGTRKPVVLWRFAATRRREVAAAR